MNILKALFILVAIITCSSKVSTQTSRIDEILAKRDSIIRSHIGKPLRDFLATSQDKVPVSNKDLIGKVTIINFWFATCSPCIAEFSDLNELYGKFKDNPDFQFISLTFQPFSIINDIIKEHKMPYNVYTMSAEDCNRLKSPGGYPVTIITDREGKVALFKSGGHTEKGKVIQQIKQYELRISELL